MSDNEEIYVKIERVSPEPHKNLNNLVVHTEKNYEEVEIKIEPLEPSSEFEEYTNISKPMFQNIIPSKNTINNNKCKQINEYAYINNVNIKNEPQNEEIIRNNTLGSFVSVNIKTEPENHDTNKNTVSNDPQTSEREVRIKEEAVELEEVREENEREEIGAVKVTIERLSSDNDHKAVVKIEVHPIEYKTTSTKIDGGHSKQEPPNTKLTPQKCPHCKAVFPNKSQLSHHWADEPTHRQARTSTGKRKDTRIRKKWNCQYCDKSYSQRCYLLVHESAHLGQHVHCCITCRKHFSTAASMRRHMPCVLASERPKTHACQTCGEAFTQRSNLIKHERYFHSENRSYLCSNCKKGYASVEGLARHKCSKDTGYYSCKICKTVLSTKYQLLVHKKLHENEFVCDICSKPFAWKSKLITHLRTHSGEKPFSCYICKELFTQKGHLDGHVRRKHTVELPVEWPQE